MTDKILVGATVLFATMFSLSVSDDVSRFFSNYFAGAATCAALFYITEC